MLVLLLLYPIRFKTYSSQFRRDIMARTGNFKTGLLWRFCWSISAVTARRLNTQANENQSWNWISAKRSSRIRLAVSLRERKYREKKEKILLEGWRLIKDALLAGAQPINIFFSDKKLIEKLPFIQDKGVLFPVDLNIMQRLSWTVTPPGIVAVFNRPDQGNSIQLPTTFQYKKQKLSLTVICDGVKDPSNLGTLIRVCAAAGCSSLITTKGSMDVWDPKVLRCAAGGHFHLPVFYSLPWQSILNHIEENTRIFMADSNIETSQPSQVYGSPSKAHYEVDWTLGPNVLFVGGETTGLSNETRRLISERGAQPIRIPMVDGVDSLSVAVAASVIVYEAYRQKNRDIITH